MSDLLMASIRERLWHKMRHDLASYIPDIAQNKLLMCCTCGRLLPQEWFDLEHLVPQQALKRDPDIVQTNPKTTKNVRAGNLLLCKKPLTLNGRKVYSNGCNSWKGRFYDTPVSEFFSGKMLQSEGSITDTHIIAAIALAYLAMVAEFGYIIVLMPSGLLMRQQFFSPRKFHRELPLRSQLVLGGGLPPPAAKIWAKPFSFGFDRTGLVSSERGILRSTYQSRAIRASRTQGTSASSRPDISCDPISRRSSSNAVFRRRALSEMLD